MRYIKSYNEAIKKKRLYAKGGVCRVYPFLNQKDKIIKTGDNPAIIEEHAFIFKKRPDIFPIVYKEGYNYLVLEKLNDKKAKKDIEEMLAYYTEKYNLKGEIPTYVTIMDYIFIDKMFKHKVDKHEGLWNRIKYIVKSIKPFYKEDEYPDIHSSNFGYTKDGILKFLDI